jgi:hypothetical protein
MSEYKYTVLFRHQTTGSFYSVIATAADDDKALVKARFKLRAHMSRQTLPNWNWFSTVLTA